MAGVRPRNREICLCVQKAHAAKTLHPGARNSLLGGAERSRAVTHAAGATTAAPSIISIVLRAGWSLRGVENRYFRHEAAGDQYLGRILAGLDPTSGEFAILPPWFAATTQAEKKIVQGKGSILAMAFFCTTLTPYRLPQTNLPAACDRPRREIATSSRDVSC